MTEAFKVGDRVRIRKGARINWQQDLSREAREVTLTGVMTSESEKFQLLSWKTIYGLVASVCAKDVELVKDN